MSDGDWSGWYDSHDWDAQNKRIAAMDEPYQEPTPRPNTYRPARALTYYFQEVHKKQLTGSTAIQSTRKYFRNVFPRNWEVTEVSRGTCDTLSKGDTTFERLGIKAGNDYVTIVRYDGQDQYIVDVNGHASQMTSDAIDAFVEDNLGDA